MFFFFSLSEFTSYPFFTGMRQSFSFKRSRLSIIRWSFFFNVDAIFKARFKGFIHMIHLGGFFNDSEIFIILLVDFVLVFIHFNFVCLCFILFNFNSIFIARYNRIHFVGTSYFSNSYSIIMDQGCIFHRQFRSLLLWSILVRDRYMRQLIFGGVRGQLFLLQNQAQYA
ncbi:hypothetical protein C2G38_111351 [Gigaspora rosea]|uniref:Uncharacterized protein n=1 Tax=Gigaspora rosea TaxID=44941 RepID=A0A397UW06_9GLOM|nr:hypothetical protein C2G38_111351 [Gigaspora rosea]